MRTAATVLAVVYIVVSVLLGVTAMGAKPGKPTHCCPTTYPAPVNHP